MKLMARFINFIWYTDQFIPVWLSPFSLVFIDVVRFRRFLYRKGLLRIKKLPVPVIIVGNITVGGTGKTPLCIWLAGFLKQQGYRPGIISRGYGGRTRQWPQRVSPDSDPLQVGDEALLLARHTECLVVAGPKRVKAAQMLLQNTDCNVILSDDGLQHYALGRDIEVAVIDGKRRLGNSYCLPAGPLREPVQRLKEVDLIICNGATEEANEFSMHYQCGALNNMFSGEQIDLQQLTGTACHAIAGIGNPQNFFDLLQQAGLECETHPFPDHYEFQADDLKFDDNKPLLMTEKDAVKCMKFATKLCWYLSIQCQPEQPFATRLLELLAEKIPQKPEQN